MKTQVVKARDGKEKDAKEVQVNIQVPETCEEAIQVFGAENVLSNALANWTVTLQSAIRRYLRAGKTQEEIQGLLANAKMGAALERISDPKAAMLAKFNSMSQEEKAAFIAELQAKAAGQGIGAPNDDEEQE